MATKKKKTTKKATARAGRRTHLPQGSRTPGPEPTAEWSATDREHGRRKLSLGELAEVLDIPGPDIMEDLIEMADLGAEAYADGVDDDAPQWEREEAHLAARVEAEDAAFRVYANGLEAAANEILWDYHMELDEIPGNPYTYYLKFKPGHGSADALLAIETFMGVYEGDDHGYYFYREQTEDARPMTEAVLFGAWYLPFRYRSNEAEKTFRQQTDIDVERLRSRQRRARSIEHQNPPSTPDGLGGDVTTADIKRAMQELLDSGECIDRTTGLANLTELAEAAAHELDHDEWLDDETHEVWDLAIEVADAMGFGE